MQSGHRVIIPADDASALPQVTPIPPLPACSHEMLFQIARPAKRMILTRLPANENLPANRARPAGGTVWLAGRVALSEDFRG